MVDLSEFEAVTVDHQKVLGQIADLLKRNGIDVEDIGKVHRVNVWQGMAKIKDDDGTEHMETVDLTGVQLSPIWDEGPQWPVVQQAKPCVVRHGRVAANKSDVKTTVILPDPQVGYRRLDSGELVPMHDEQAIACSIELLALIRPQRVIFLGDTLDFAEWSSKFLVLPEFVFTTQPTIDYAHRYLAESLAAAGPQVEDAVLFEGNHDERLAKAIARNAMAAMRLRQANAPESWPVMSVPHLLRLEELGIRYADGYPAIRLKIADAHGAQTALFALHGEKMSMEKQAKIERVSTVQGHAHHFSMHAETADMGDGQAAEVESWSLGCLCRTDGAVPSTKGGTDSFGRYVTRIESWQHGIGVLTEDEEGWNLEPVRIRNGRARWNGVVVTA